MANVFFVFLHTKKIYKYNKGKRLNFMIIVPIREGENVDRALKKLKRKFEKTGTVKELRERQKFTKKSVKRREQIKKAIYIQKLHDQKDE
jgi:small subunit ribosomal protein S21